MTTLLLAALLFAPSTATRVALHVQPSIVAAGARVHVFGNADGCPRSDTVLVLSNAFPGHGFAGVGTITARVGTSGSFSAYGHVRRLAKRGRYRITARCGGGNLGVSAVLRVR